MSIETLTGADVLVDRLRAAVALADAPAVTARIQADLEEILGAGRLRLPERFRRPLADTYARRLLHTDPEHDFVAVVMTWGPGQATPLHDHAGSWCVEGVVEGEIRVTRYEKLGESEGGEELVRFARRETVRAAEGSAGALIPPQEYHVLGNARDDRIAMTLHVYQGKMDHCYLFEPVAAAGGRTGEEEVGWYRRRLRRLGYHD